MLHHPPEDYGRAVNLILALISLVWLVCRRVIHNDWYRKNVSTIRNDLWLMAVFWVCAVVVGTVEQLFHTDTNARVVFTTAAIVVTLRILIRPFDHWNDLKNP